jgi:hypothetical protein
MGDGGVLRGCLKLKLAATRRALTGGDQRSTIGYLVRRDTQVTKEKVKQLYGELCGLSPGASGVAKRKRGYDFERLLHMLLSVDELEPRTGYKPKGEQIDGSLYLDGRFHLLEAKWHADPMPASTLYQFKGKVDGKLIGTIGLFISMSGYAEDAVDALTLGKGLNLILFDRSDMDVAIRRGVGFKAILKLKLRKAAEEGVVYFPAEIEEVTAAKSETTANDVLVADYLGIESLPIGIPKAERPFSVAADLLIVCEGDTDRLVIGMLAERVLAHAGSKRVIKIAMAMGKRSIPRMANALWDNAPTLPKVLVVTDGDDDPEGTKAMLSKELKIDDWVAAIPNPEIETWLDLKPLRPSIGKTRLALYWIAVADLDIAALSKRDEQFRIFYNAILGL